ncbi:hypothetical protein D8674_026073 [Pyrus ussuriensis x Pyrus communis]|uniref:Uncharacterized protein n=1 Tax=Pyrus ussuriensis x Pyrus communis TaxID=2448454 RepID=A0A5N5I737_9ROSA|nr:hypothetical protein D8674_026073 [Pyrus ussuriensis x Pyrus communis]
MCQDDLTLLFATQTLLIHPSSLPPQSVPNELPSSLLTPAPLSVQFHRCSSSHSHSHQVLCYIGLTTSFLKKWDVVEMLRRPKPFGSSNHTGLKKRRTLICVANQDVEEAFRKTVEVDRLIDKLGDLNPIEKLVVENVLAFNEGFWIRLAARNYKELAISIMSIVDCLVHETNEKINSAINILKGVLKPVVDHVEEIRWPLRDPKALKLMEKEIFQREQEGQLDKGFLQSLLIPGLERSLLTYILQLSTRGFNLSPEEEWNKLLINGLTIGQGEISPQELYAVIKKREGGSYQ